MSIPGLGGGTYYGPIVTPLTFPWSGDGLVDWLDRLQLAAGLVLIGVGVGTALAIRTRPPKPSRKRPPVRSGYQA